MTDDEHKLLAERPATKRLLLAGRWDGDSSMLGRLHSGDRRYRCSLSSLGSAGGFQGGPVKVTQQMANALRRRMLTETRKGGDS